MSNSKSQETKAIAKYSPAAPAPAKSKPTLFLAGLAISTIGLLSFSVTGLSLLGLSAILFGIAMAFAHKIFRSPSLDDLSQRIEASQEAKLKEVKRQIRKAQYLENIGAEGERAAAQLEAISERFAKFQKVLDLKFHPGEITHTRYLTAAQQTYLSAIDGLESASIALEAINAMGKPDAHEPRERNDLRKKQTASVHELLEINERAITEFDRVSTA